MLIIMYNDVRITVSMVKYNHYSIMLLLYSMLNWFTLLASKMAGDCLRPVYMCTSVATLASRKARTVRRWVSTHSSSHGRSSKCYASLDIHQLEYLEYFYRTRNYSYMDLQGRRECSYVRIGVPAVCWCSRQECPLYAFMCARIVM